MQCLVHDFAIYHGQDNAQRWVENGESRRASFSEVIVGVSAQPQQAGWIVRGHAHCVDQGCSHYVHHIAQALVHGRRAAGEGTISQTCCAIPHGHLTTNEAIRAVSKARRGHRVGDQDDAVWSQATQQ